MKKRLLVLFSMAFAIIGHQQLSSQNDNIQVTSKRNDDKTVDISYTKKLPGSYCIMIQFTSMQNCYQKDFKTVIKSTSGRLLTLKPLITSNLLIIHTALSS